jgi:hypothetical protein
VLDRRQPRHPRFVRRAGAEPLQHFRLKSPGTSTRAPQEGLPTIREDGAFIEAGENDNLIVQKLEANPKALGIFGFSFLEENLDQLRGLKIDGVEPSFETIESGRFPAARPLFIYVKKAHVGVIPIGSSSSSTRARGVWRRWLFGRHGLVLALKPERDKVRRDATALVLKAFEPTQPPKKHIGRTGK